MAGLPGVEAVTVYGVSIPGMDGKAGMAGVVLEPHVLHSGAEAVCRSVSSFLPVLEDSLPRFALPRFIRVVDSLQQTHTFKTRKVELVARGFAPSALQLPPETERRSHRPVTSLPDVFVLSRTSTPGRMEYVPLTHDLLQSLEQILA